MLVVSRPYPGMTFLAIAGTSYGIDGGLYGIDHKCSTIY